MASRVKGMPPVTHYTLNYEGVLANSHNIFKNDLYAQSFYQKAKSLFVLAQSISTKSITRSSILEEGNNKEKKRINDRIVDDKPAGGNFNIEIWEVPLFLDNLEKNFNARREEKKPGKYPPARLPFKKEVAKNAHEAMCEFGTELISDAWLVFTDKMIEGEFKKIQILKYFFSKKEDSFDVIGSMADAHNTTYVYTKSK